MATVPRPGVGDSPLTTRIATKNRVRPARNAPSRSTIRGLLASVASLISTKARDKAGADGLEEDRSAVMGPERDGASQHTGNSGGRRQPRAGRRVATAGGGGRGATDGPQN